MSQDSGDSKKGFSVNVSGWRGSVGWVRQKIKLERYTEAR